MATFPELQRTLRELHAEALRVGDSPLRADQLAARIARLAGTLGETEAPDELRARVRAALLDAERVVRRDDDGREAARHLQSAQRHADNRPRRLPPF